MAIWSMKAVHDGLISTATVVSSGLQLYLDAGIPASYSGTGSTWTDLSGNGNNFTIFNSPTWSSSNGGRFTLNGSNQYFSTSGFANFTSGITIFAICNFGTGSSWERIMDFGNGSNSDNIYFARQETGTILVFGLIEGSTNRGTIGNTTGVLNSTVASYAATLNGSTGSLYRNGSLITGPTSFPYLPRNVTRSNCYIGRSNWNDAYFETTMSVFMIYNRALSDAEIAQNYNFFKGRFGI